MSYRSELASFRRLKLPHDSRNISADDLDSKFAAINFIRSLAEKITQYRTSDRKLLAKLFGLDSDDVWKRLFAWMIVLFGDYHIPVDSSSPSRWEAISYLCCVLTYYIENNIHLVLSTSGTFDLAVRLYINTDYDYECSPHSQYYGWWGPFLTLHIHTGAESSFIRKICQIEGITRQLIANLTLKRIQASGKIENRSPLQYQFLLEVMNNNELAPTSGVGIPLTRIIRAFTSSTKTMTSYLKNHQTEIESRIRDAWAVSCLHHLDYLSRTLEYARSIEVVCEAIKLDIISTFIDYASFFRVVMQSDGFSEANGKEVVDRVIGIISKNIPQFMMYASVVIALRNSGVEKIRDDHMSTTIAGKDWEEFKDSLDKYSMILHIDMTYIAFCENPKHHLNWKVNPSELYQCAGCKLTWYCSEICQREHWNNTHRNECKALISKFIPPQALNIRKRDLRYVLHYAILSFKAQWPELKELSQKTGQSMTEMTFNFNIAQYPNQTLEAQMRSLSKVANIASSCGQNTIVLHVLVPMGRFCNGLLTVVCQYDERTGEMETIWTTGKSNITYLARR